MEQNGPGHNSTKGTVERKGQTPTIGPKNKIDGDRHTRDADKNDGQGRIQGVEKTDTEAANSQEGKTGNFERGGLVGGRWIMRVKKIMVMI